MIIPSNVGSAAPVVIKGAANSKTFPAHSVGDMLVYVGFNQGSAATAGFTQISAFDATSGWSGWCGYRVATDVSYTVSNSAQYSISIVLSPCQFSTASTPTNTGYPNQSGFSYPDPGGLVGNEQLIGINAGTGNAANYDRSGVWTDITPSQYYGDWQTFKPTITLTTANWNGGDFRYVYAAEQHQSTHFLTVFKPA